MPKKSMRSQGENQQLCLWIFPAESTPTGKKPSNKPKPKVNTRRKRPEVVYTYQFTSETSTMPVDRIPTGLAAKLLRKDARSMRRGFTYRAQGFHGGSLVAVWAGTNPEDRRESLWDIHLEQAS